MADQLPLLSTAGIEDRQTRNFLDRLVEAWQQRAEGEDRFVSADEFEQLTGDVIAQAFSDGVTGGASGTTKSSVSTAIAGLTESIRRSVLFQALEQQVIALSELQALRDKVEAATGDPSGAGISAEITTRSAKDSALASAINRIWAYIGGSTAVIEDGELASATASAATATKWNTVIAAVTDPNTGLVNAASIKQELNTYANSANNTFNAIYTVRAQVAYGGTVVAGGFGLAATAGAGSAAGPQITMGVLSNQFFIAAPAVGNDPATEFGVSNGMPFVVVTTPTLINGVTFQPGTYIKKALIGEATIDSAKIANAAITNAKIGQAEIDTLKIGSAAITVSSFDDGTQTHAPLGSGFVTICSTPILIAGLGGGEVAGTILVGNVTWYEGGGSAVTAVCTIFVNGAQYSESGATLGESKTSTVSAFANLPNGSHTIDLRVRITNGTKNVTTVGSLITMSGKR